MCTASVFVTWTTALVQSCRHTALMSEVSDQQTLESSGMQVVPVRTLYMFITLVWSQKLWIHIFSNCVEMYFCSDFLSFLFIKHVNEMCKSQLLYQTLQNSSITYSILLYFLTLGGFSNIKKKVLYLQ